MWSILWPKVWKLQLWELRSRPCIFKGAIRGDFDFSFKGSTKSWQPSRSKWTEHFNSTRLQVKTVKMSRGLASRVPVMFCVFNQLLVTQCVCFVKIQWPAHLGQLHYIFLGTWCMHFSRYILYLNKFFKVILCFSRILLYILFLPLSKCLFKIERNPQEQSLSNCIIAAFGCSASRKKWLDILRL